MLGTSEPRKILWRSHPLRGGLAQAQPRIALRPRRRQRLGQDHVPQHPLGARRRDRGQRQPAQGGAARRAPAGSVPRRRGDHPRPHDDGDRAVWDALTEQQRILDGQGDPRASSPSRTCSAPTTATPRVARDLDPRGPRHPLRDPPAAARHASGGFKLRVLLAQVLLGGPDVLLLDEPPPTTSTSSRSAGSRSSSPRTRAAPWSSATISASSTTSRPTCSTSTTAPSPSTPATTPRS